MSSSAQESLKEGVGYPGIGVTNGCKLLDMGTGTQT